MTQRLSANEEIKKRWYIRPYDDNMDGAWKHDAQWKKPITKDPIDMKWPEQASP